MDELAWVRYKNQEKKKLAREHIIAVTHGKAQNDIGKGSPCKRWRPLKVLRFLCKFPPKNGWLA